MYPILVKKTLKWPNYNIQMRLYPVNKNFGYKHEQHITQTNWLEIPDNGRTIWFRNRDNHNFNKLRWNYTWRKDIRYQVLDVLLDMMQIGYKEDLLETIKSWCFVGVHNKESIFYFPKGHWWHNRFLHYVIKFRNMRDIVTSQNIPNNGLKELLEEIQCFFLDKVCICTPHTINK